MKVHQQGWNEAVGVFNCDVTIDEAKLDYEIHFTNGTICRQQTPFEQHVLRQEPDGELEQKIGAFFDYRGNRELFTPAEMASLALNGYAVIPGLVIENRQTTLADRIRAANQRAGAVAAQQEHTAGKQVPSPVL